MENAAIDHAERLNQVRKDDLKMLKNGQQYPDDLRLHNESYNPENKREEDSNRAVKMLKDGKNIFSAVSAFTTGKGAFSLLRQVDFLGDIPYIMAIGAAILKDLLDFLTGPTVIFAILFSILCSIFIFMMMLIVGANSKKKGMGKIFQKIGMVCVGGIADSIPGLDFLPIETFTVIIVYFVELVERKNTQE